MGKRKHQAISHTQEHCDVWLSTADRKEQVSKTKRQRLLTLGPVSNISNIILSSQPIKAGTKQTNIQQFFGQKTAPGNENQEENELSDETSQRSRLPGRTKMQNREDIGTSDTTLINSPQSTMCLNATEHHQDRREAKSEMRYFGEDQETVSSQSLEDMLPFSSGSYNGAIFTLNSQNVYEIKDKARYKRIIGHDPSNLGNHSYDECSPESTSLLSNPTAKGVGKATKSFPQRQIEKCESPLDDNKHSDSSWDNGSDLEPNVLRPSCKVSASHRCVSEEGNYSRVTDASDLTTDSDVPSVVSAPDTSVLLGIDKDNFAFTIAPQGCFKLKEPSVQNNSKLKQSSNSARAKYTPKSKSDSSAAQRLKRTKHFNSTNIQEHQTALQNPTTTETEDVDFTMATEGYLKIRDPCFRSKLDQLSRNKELDNAQGSWQVQNSDQSQNSSSSQSLSDSEDIDFTMGTQGCLKVRYRGCFPKVNKLSRKKAHSIHEIKSRDGGYTNVSDIAQSCGSSVSRIHADSEGVDFTVSTQGCLKIKERPCRPEVHQLSKGDICSLRTKSSSDECEKFSKVGDPMSSPGSQSTPDSEDIDFTMSSQGCWRIRDRHLTSKVDQLSKHEESGRVVRRASAHDSKEANDSSPSSELNPVSPSCTDSDDIEFTLSSQGCLKIRDLQCRAEVGQLTSSEECQMGTVKSQTKERRNVRSFNPLCSSTQSGSVRSFNTFCSSTRNTASHLSDSDDVGFTVATQGCLKIRDPAGSAKVSQIFQMDEVSDGVTDNNTQGCVYAKTKDAFDDSKISTFSQDSEEVIFTMGPQGCLKIK